MLEWTPEDLKTHLDAGDRVFLKLWKPGCGACKLSIPAIERIEADDRHSLLYGKINTDEYPEMLEISQSEVLPVFFVFIDGKMEGKFLGFKGLKKLEEFVDTAAI